MKTILVGYKEENGHGAEVLLGPDDSEKEKSSVMEAAKRRHVFPKGFVRISQYILGEPCETAIFISEETSKLAQATHAAGMRREKEAAEIAAHKEKISKHIQEAETIVKASANARNAAFSQLAGLKTRQGNLFDEGKTKEAEAMAAEISKVQKEAEVLAQAFQSTLQKMNILRNRETSKEDFENNLAELKSPKTTETQKTN